MTLSAPLLSKTRVIKVKLESTKGTYIATDQAVYFEDAKMECTGPFIERNGTGLYRGHAAAGVIGELSGKFTGTCEMKGNGTTGCEAGLAIMLQACGLAKSSEVYQIHSTHANDKTITIEMWESGRKKCLIGASGTVIIRGVQGGRVMCEFDIDGCWQAPVDDALPTWSPTATKPFMLKSGTFTLATNAIKISEFSLDMGCVVVPRRDITAASGIRYFMPADILPMFNCDPEADLVAGYDYHGIWLAGTEAAVSLIVTNGTTKCTITLPKVQSKAVPENDREGILIHDFSGQCNHSSGNDSVALTFAAA